MTGLGLAVAIPAVLAYNTFVRNNRVFLSRLDAFAHDLFAFLTTGQQVALSDGRCAPCVARAAAPNAGANKWPLAASRARGGSSTVSEINMVPLIDVMLVLLVIFIITAPLLAHSIKINMPQVAAEQIEEAQDRGPGHRRQRRAVLGRSRSTSTTCRIASRRWPATSRSPRSASAPTRTPATRRWPRSWPRPVVPA